MESEKEATVRLGKTAKNQITWSVVVKSDDDDDALERAEKLFKKLERKYAKN